MARSMSRARWWMSTATAGSTLPAASTGTKRPKWKKHAYYFEDAEKRDFVHDHCTEDALDVNKDGLVDVVNSGYQPDIQGVLWHENPGQRGGKWKVHRVHASPSMEGIVLADIDGDGDSDILLNHFRLYGGLEGEGAVARMEPLVWLESIDKEPWLVKRVIADRRGRSRLRGG